MPKRIAARFHGVTNDNGKAACCGLALGWTESLGFPTITLADMTPPAYWATSTRMPSASLHDVFAAGLTQAVSSRRTSTRGVNKAALQKQADASAWFLECLYQGFCCLPMAVVALPRSTAAYSTNRLNSVPYGYDVVTRVLDAATSLGWATVTPGFERGEEGQGQVTRIQAAGDLLIHFHSLSVQWQELTSPPPEELIVIAMEAKGKGRRFALREEDHSVAPMQDNLDRINRYLLTQCIHLNCADSVLLDPVDGVVSQGKVKATLGRYNPKDRPRTLNYQAVAMRRIFAHGSLGKGGRFYDGWWQHIRSEYRQRILIKDHLTAECDYSGIALVCLYAREGQPMDDGDPYDIGLGYSDGSDPRRKIVKQYLNAIINDAKGKYRIDSDKLRLLGLTSKELRRRIHKKHHRVRHMFHTGIGLELQYVDSKIAEQVMLRFVEMDEVCLPVHDSFIVRRGMERKLLETMQAEFERETGTTIKIRSAMGGSSDGFGTLSDSVQPHPSESVTDAIATMFGRHMRDFSITMSYLNSWREKRMTEQERRSEDLAIEHVFQTQKETGRHPRPFGINEAIAFLSPTLGGDLPGNFQADGEREEALRRLEGLLRRVAGRVDQ